ncbi:hypothetical protein ACFZAC_26180 [Pseudomonas fluorescens]|uniref:hypothetical protein n=1 Tax=Pseudomonas fluorescens TaxID=294 RepID=UPI00374A3D94
MRRNVEALLAQLEGAGINLEDIAGAILDRLDKDRTQPLELGADPAITLLQRDRKNPPKYKSAPRTSPGERLRRELRRKGLPVVPFDGMGA